MNLFLVSTLWKFNRVISRVLQHSMVSTCVMCISQTVTVPVLLPPDSLQCFKNYLQSHSILFKCLLLRLLCSTVYCAPHIQVQGLNILHGKVFFVRVGDRSEKAATVNTRLAFDRGNPWIAWHGQLKRACEIQWSNLCEIREIGHHDQTDKSSKYCSSLSRTQRVYFL